MIIKLLIILTIIINVTPVYAITNVKVSKIESVPYDYTSQFKGTKIIGVNEIEGTNKKFVITSNEEYIEIGEEGYYKSNYVVNYTTDGVNYKQTNLDKVIENTYGVKEDEYTSIYILEDTPFINKDTLVIYGYIFRYVETDNFEERRNNEYFLLATKDGINYQKSVLPEYNELYNKKINAYNGTYIYGGELYKQESLDKNYYYYISQDLTTWTKKEISFDKFGQDIAYDISYMGISANGAIFGADDQKEVITKDFINYKQIDNSTITAPSSIIVQNGKDWDYTLTPQEKENVYVMKSQPESSKETQPYEIKNAYKTFMYGEGLTKGFDIYISNPHGNKYEHLYGSNEIVDYNLTFRPYYEYNKASTINPIYLFISNQEKTKVVVFNDYNKKDYVEYNLDITKMSIFDIKRIDDHLFVQYYSKEPPVKLLIINLKNKEMNIMDLPSQSNIKTLAKNLIFVDQNDKIATINISKIPTTQEPEKIAGDVSGNGELDLSDILITLKTYFNPSIQITDAQKTAMDINNDGKIDLTDILLLLKAFFKA